MTTPADSRRASLRRDTLVLAVVLIVQYAIGMVVNIYVTVPKTDQGVGLGKAFGDAMSKGPASLAIHTGVGVILVLASVGLVVHALLSGHRVVLVSSVVALLAIVGAAFDGADFVNNGQDSASLTMALLTALALLCAIVNLYVLGSPAQTPAPTQAPTPAQAAGAEADSRE